MFARSLQWLTSQPLGYRARIFTFIYFSISIEPSTEEWCSNVLEGHRSCRYRFWKANTGEETGTSESMYQCCVVILILVSISLIVLQLQNYAHIESTVLTENKTVREALTLEVFQKAQTKTVNNEVFCDESPTVGSLWYFICFNAVSPTLLLKYSTL